MVLNFAANKVTTCKDYVKHILNICFFYVSLMLPN